MKKFFAMLLAILLCVSTMTGAFAQSTTKVLEQARMYDSAFDTKVRLLIPQGGEVELVEIGEERVLVRYGAFCGWIERSMIDEKAIEEFAAPTAEPTKETMAMVTPSPAAQEEMAISDSTQSPENEAAEAEESAVEEAAAETEETAAVEETVQEAEETEQETAEETTEEPAAEPVSTIKPLKLNSYGERVEELQQNLTELGYSVGKIDGVYGKKTRTAVIKLQRYYGLQADGIAGENTLSLIEALMGPEAENVKPAPLPFVRVLRKGKSGEEVQKLQQILAELEYLTQEQITGVYDKVTVEAVKTFQRQAGLEVDGVAGEKTIFVLSSTVAAQRMVKELDNH